MTKAAVSFRAVCTACNRAYRVPSAGRTYTCKACGGVVRERREEDESRRRPPLLESDADEGADVEASLEDNVARRFEANAALKEAYRWIDGVAWMYRLGALAYAVATLFAVLALARDDVPVDGGLLVVGLTTALSVMMLMGSIHILFQPFLWTVAIGALASAVTVVHVVGPNPYGWAMAGSGAWAALAWAALVPTLRFKKLVAKHTDLYVMHHASLHTRRALKGRSGDELHERLQSVIRRAGGRAWRNSLLAATAMIAVVVLAANTVIDGRAVALDGPRAAFEQAWHASDLDAIEGMVHPQVRDAEMRWLRGVADANRWTGALPPLVDGREEPRDEEGERRFVYRIGGTELGVAWVLDGSAWQVVDLDVAGPPVDDTLDRFVAAWESSDPERVAAFFSEENRGALLTTLANARDDRGWSTFPAVDETKVSSDGSEVLALLTVDGGELLTRWHVRGDASWGLHGLKLPKKKREAQ